MSKQKFKKKASGLYVPVKKRMVKPKRNWLERKLDEYNHTMELIRTILPIAILVLQIYILIKVL